MSSCGYRNCYCNKKLVTEFDLVASIIDEKEKLEGKRDNTDTWGTE